MTFTVVEIRCHRHGSLRAELTAHIEAAREHGAHVALANLLRVVPCADLRAKGESNG